jgi:hypothetical protein
MTIYIKKSETADTRTCDYKNVSEQKLLDSSYQHIMDVFNASLFLWEEIQNRFNNHDRDKITGITQFHKDFTTGFAEHTWWDNHKKISRHHLHETCVDYDKIDLIDVLEYISDCVMAGMARSGSVYDLQISNELLQMAFKNTVNLLKRNVEVVEEK